MANGTSSTCASVRASSVLPDPVGPIIRMLLFSISTSAFASPRAGPASADAAAGSWSRRL